jgi:hypothetical protein
MSCYRTVGNVKTVLKENGTKFFKRSVHLENPDVSPGSSEKRAAEPLFYCLRMIRRKVRPPAGSRRRVFIRQQPLPRRVGDQKDLEGIF